MHKRERLKKEKGDVCNVIWWFKELLGDMDREVYIAFGIVRLRHRLLVDRVETAPMRILYYIKWGPWQTLPKTGWRIRRLGTFLTRQQPESARVTCFPHTQLLLMLTHKWMTKRNVSQLTKHALLPRNLVMFFTTFSACHSLVCLWDHHFHSPFYTLIFLCESLSNSMEYQPLVPLIVHVKAHFHNWVSISLSLNYEPYLQSAFVHIRCECYNLL